MEKNHGIGMSLMEVLAALIMVLVVFVASVPSIMLIGFKHLKYKIKL
jgi:hypothetical protein